MTDRASLFLPIAAATLGIALFSAMDAVMKSLTLAIGAYNALLWRTMAGALFGGIGFFSTRQAWPPASTLRIHFARGALSSVMGIFFFWGLARVPLAQGIALSFVAPLIALYLAALVLKEQVHRRAVLGSLLGFAGVLVILFGQRHAELGPEALAGSLAILFSAVCYAWNIILMRKQALVARPLEVAFFTSAVMTLCFLLAAPFLAAWPPSAAWPGVAGAAFLAFASLLFLSWAYARAEAQNLAPVEYSAFIWAALFGFLFFAEPVRPLTLIGAAMIVAGCVVAARRTPSPVIHAAAGA